MKDVTIVAQDARMAPLMLRDVEKLAMLLPGIVSERKNTIRYVCLPIVARKTSNGITMMIFLCPHTV
jgi:hypothetical protein